MCSSPQHPVCCFLPPTTLSSSILTQTLRWLILFASLTHSLAPVTPPDLQISFTLTPSGSLWITLLQDSPLCLTIFPSLRQTCFHLSHQLFQLLPMSFLAFLSDRLIQLPEGFFGFFFHLDF